MFWSLTCIPHVAKCDQSGHYKSILYNLSTFRPNLIIFTNDLISQNLLHRVWPLCQTSSEVCRTCPAYFAITVSVYVTYSNQVCQSIYFRTYNCLLVLRPSSQLRYTCITKIYRSSIQVETWSLSISPVMILSSNTCCEVHHPLYWLSVCVTGTNLTSDFFRIYQNKTWHLNTDFIFWQH